VAGATAAVPHVGRRRRPGIEGRSDQDVKRNHRHRRRWVLAGLAAAVVVGAGVFALLWVRSGAHELPLSVAYQRFRPDAPGKKYANEALRPEQGVYQYSGSGTEHLSVPLKTQYEGPVIPGTVTYLRDGCWSFRLDYSDNHWQSATYCPRSSALLLTARGGWYRWNFVALSVSDTSTYSCTPAEVAVPAVLVVGERHSFSCRGSNHPLSIPPVTMSGWVEYLGSSSVVVQGHRLQALHLKEVATFSGGQTGTNVADTWFELATGLPLRGTWSTTVRTASPLGTSTLTASGRFSLSSFTPHT
jgi:hypothetical protein